MNVEDKGRHKATIVIDPEASDLIVMSNDTFERFLEKRRNTCNRFEKPQRGDGFPFRFGHHHGRHGRHEKFNRWNQHRHRGKSQPDHGGRVRDLFFKMFLEGRHSHHRRGGRFSSGSAHGLSGSPCSSERPHHHGSPHHGPPHHGPPHHGPHHHGPHHHGPHHHGPHHHGPHHHGPPHRGHHHEDKDDDFEPRGNGPHYQHRDRSHHHRRGGCRGKFWGMQDSNRENDESDSTNSSSDSDDTDCNEENYELFVKFLRRNNKDRRKECNKTNIASEETAEVSSRAATEPQSNEKVAEENTPEIETIDIDVEKE